MSALGLVLFVVSCVMVSAAWLGGPGARAAMLAAARVLVRLARLALILAAALGIAGAIIYGIVRVVRMAWGGP